MKLVAEIAQTFLSLSVGVLGFVYAWRCWRHR